MNGYRYHTKYDHIDYIPQPCLQRTGDNVLGLVRSIANSEQLNDIKVVVLLNVIFTKIDESYVCRLTQKESTFIMTSLDLCLLHTDKMLRSF